MGKNVDVKKKCKYCGTEYPDTPGSSCPHCGGTGGGTVISINPLVIIKPVIWLIKLGLWVLKKICKLLFSKVGFTILTLGLGLLAYKLLNKIYGD